MTPKERALSLCNGMFTGHQELYQAEIEAAISAAIAAEREACAKIADEAGAWCRSFSIEETADMIRDKIRARGTA